MALSEFDVLGEEVSDEETGEILKKGDPRRSLVRYQPNGGELFVSARISLPLLKTAASRPVLLLMPSSREDEVLRPSNPALRAAGGWDLLTPEGSRRNWRLLERICEDLTKASVPACYLAEQHGANRRDFYFVTEDVAGVERIAYAAAEALFFPLAIERRCLAEVAPIIVPTEVIGELDLDVSDDARIRPTRFEFWGADASLAKLRSELEQRGYQYIGFDPGMREMRMAKPVPIDGPGFLAVLKEIASLARSLGCSYRGTETVGGSAQFALDRPLPDRYAAKAGVLGRLFERWRR
ncbi:hypothetical protein GOFOIKOB_5230 [Methylobacterium tardum]|uniref:Uncharacterized protein n=1 Tax=Methylobacterium tardum TaxID=374432 RepID=A0AA37WV34_9HYPH|nr:hypothetical protein [Methylobacterium tardum]URD38136.1 hypothetical protein M6G65_06610 [Methylobacterium tardum]GJE52162.1 hypothetical protein GOFOIKOB_5230 [Methylobacterium tardum]GLS71728.1 hypothetical protein GCM10007890_37410 [Methylobacterium tardum]